MFDIIIIGSGFYGLSIGNFFVKKNLKVLIIEENSESMRRASLNNQARVHNGYHYPRSYLTANRSHLSFDDFCLKYSDCIFSDFTSLYAIPKIFSKVNSIQFKNLFDRIGAPIKKDKFYFNNYFNKQLVESVFEVKEYCFDSNKLKRIVLDDYLASGGQIVYNSSVEKIITRNNDIIIVETSKGLNYETKKVINTTYSNINKINYNSNIDIIPLKHELTEMILVEPPIELSKISITMMCGNFFSFMPFPTTKFHTISHVRYTPHLTWFDNDRLTYKEINYFTDKYIKNSKKLFMLSDIKRYVPLLSQSIYQESIWETKTILPQSDLNDSRPILFKADHKIKNYYCIMGGKIDNIFDILAELE
jgi:glycine/D-amino acid oxidase-like deaminating enzyme